MRDGCCVASDGVCEYVTFASVLLAVKEVVVYGLVSSWACGTVRSVALANSMQMIVQGDVAGAELDVDARCAFVQAIGEFDEVRGGH